MPEHRGHDPDDGQPDLGEEVDDAAFAPDHDVQGDDQYGERYHGLSTLVPRSSRQRRNSKRFWDLLKRLDHESRVTKF